MQVFRSSKNKFTTIFLWAMAVLCLLPLVFIIGHGEVQAQLFVGCMLCGFSGFFLWMYFDTVYKIDNELLYYASGPIRGKIKIASIRIIEYDNNFIKTSMYRPALNKNGLKIYYDKYEDIFISPKDSEEFIAALKAINPRIETR